MDAALIFSAMLSLAQPGVGAYSMVPEADCGYDRTVRPAGCPSEAKYNEHWGAYVRQETAAEARVRWQRIAASIARNVTIATTGDSKIWGSNADDLARAVVTVVFHESGFRSDIHAGKGYLGLGGCVDKAGARVCSTYCLMQIATGGPDGIAHGFRGRELLGTDDTATDRCILTGIRALAKVRAAGTGLVQFRDTVARYGGGGVGTNRDPWVEARVATWGRVSLVTTAAGKAP